MFLKPATFELFYMSAHYQKTICSNAASQKDASSYTQCGLLSIENATSLFNMMVVEDKKNGNPTTSKYDDVP